jgi:hypothetical protein
MFQLEVFYVYANLTDFPKEPSQLSWLVANHYHVIAVRRISRTVLSRKGLNAAVTIRNCLVDCCQSTGLGNIFKSLNNPR